MRAQFDSHREALVAFAIETALVADTSTLRRCLERAYPPVKTALFVGPLPESQAGWGERVLQLLAAGELTPDAASNVLGATARQAQIVAVSELELGIVTLEPAGETP